jgi:CheY-like chemotaxis protein
MKSLQKEILLSKEITVLLVEDNQIAMLSAKFTLQDAGCVVDVAASGKEALEKAAQHNYDLIFMDIGLEEGTDGFMVTEQIKSRGSLNEDTLVVALTAHTQDENLSKRMKEVGIPRLITKPLQDHVDELIELINKGQKPTA